MLNTFSSLEHKTDFNTLWCILGIDSNPVEAGQMQAPSCAVEFR